MTGENNFLLSFSLAGKQRCWRAFDYPSAFYKNWSEMTTNTLLGSPVIFNSCFIKKRRKTLIFPTSFAWKSLRQLLKFTDHMSNSPYKSFANTLG